MRRDNLFIFTVGTLSIDTNNKGDGQGKKGKSLDSTPMSTETGSKSVSGKKSADTTTPISVLSPQPETPKVID